MRGVVVGLKASVRGNRFRRGVGIILVVFCLSGGLCCRGVGQGELGARSAGDAGHFWTGQIREWTLNIDPDAGWMPRGIVVNATGHVFVLLSNSAGGGSGYVQVYDPGGTFLFQWGGAGSNPGQFAEPYGIAINATGHVYVADNRNFRVQVFAPGGAYLYSIGSFGFGDGQFVAPFSVAINATGHVYVADASFYRVEVFTAAGQFLYTIGTQGTGPGLFETPHAIAVNRSNHLYVLDGTNKYLQVFDPAGQYSYTREDPEFEEMQDMFTPTFLNLTGHLLLAYESTGYAWLCSQAGAHLFSFRPAYGSSGSEFHQLVMAVAVDSQDRVYTAGPVDNKVHVFFPPYVPQTPVLQGPWLGVSLLGRVDLSWAACGGAVTYRVYRASAPITVINSSVTLLGETAGTTWGEDRDAGDYYYAVAAVNEFSQTLSASSKVVVVALIPGLPPLAGFIIVMSAVGVAAFLLVMRYLKRRKAGPVTKRSQRNVNTRLPESNA